MIELLYRIYQKKTNNGYDESYVIEMDVYCCKNRDKFKEHIKDKYGNNIAFRNSNKLQDGDLYCIIIGQMSFDYERYFSIVEYECSFCGTKVKTTPKGIVTLSNYEIDKYLASTSNNNTHQEKRFCCNGCKHKYIEQEKPKPIDTDGAELWVTKEMFPNQNGNKGYIYIITKKNTGEFYVGQTTWLPIWRWGQHLKTERFDYRNILDYKFEVIEVVGKNDNIFEREKYWIQKCYLDNPTKSLNISCTKNIELIGDEV